MDVKELFVLKNIPEKPIPAEMFLECGLDERDFIRYLSLCEYIKSVSTINCYYIPLKIEAN